MKEIRSCLQIKNGGGKSLYKKILLAVDGSEYSVRATKEAIKISSLLDDYVVEAVFVVDFAKSKSDVLHSKGKEQLELHRREKLAPIVELLKKNNINHQTKLLHGEPGPTIIDYANKESFDLLVIGSRGLNTLQEMVLGSVSHKVMKRVKCPVLLVK